MYSHRKYYDKLKPTNLLSPNHYQLLKPACENIELVSKNIHNTDALRLPGNENELNINRNVLTSQNTGDKRPFVVINKYPERKTNFLPLPVVPGTILFSEAFLSSKGLFIKRDILIFPDSIPKEI